ncbi:MAG TPA: hypothetical protein VHM91_03605, partial [Verrucomicrobiales bacterium]|nr:hypothetical protein [Verrucomicrobiales bacterium]
MFVDHIRIHARAGTGGDGSASFRREKFIPRGGPDGGDGGRGGSVILKVDTHTDNLKAFFYDPNLKATHGSKGAGRLKSGRSGEDRFFHVPPGTLVYREKGGEPADSTPDVSPDDFLVDDEAPSQQKQDAGTERSLKQRIEEGHDLELVADLTEIGQEFVLCRGGRGGKGNNNFKTATHQTPYEFTQGEKGE